jgi:hypothetical protein
VTQRFNGGGRSEHADQGALITEELRGAWEAAKIESMGYHAGFEEID